MDLLKVMKERRSTIGFKRDEIPEEILKEIFTYGSWAPNHRMKEPWEIKLYERKGKFAFVQAIITSYERIGMLKTDQDKKTIQMTKSMTDFLLQIPHHALIYFEREDNKIRYDEDYAAVCAFIQNAQLAAWTYGVGMLWTTSPYMYDPEFAKDIGLDSEKVKLTAVMQIGYPEKLARNKGRTPIKEKLQFIRE